MTEKLRADWETIESMVDGTNRPNMNLLRTKTSGGWLYLIAGSLALAFVPFTKEELAAAKKQAAEEKKAAVKKAAEDKKAAKENAAREKRQQREAEEAERLRVAAEAEAEAQREREAEAERLRLETERQRLADAKAVELREAAAKRKLEREAQLKVAQQMLAEAEAEAEREAQAEAEALRKAEEEAEATRQATAQRRAEEEARRETEAARLRTEQDRLAHESLAQAEETQRRAALINQQAAALRPVTPTPAPVLRPVATPPRLAAAPEAWVDLRTKDKQPEDEIPQLPDEDLVVEEIGPALSQSATPPPGRPSTLRLTPVRPLPPPHPGRFEAEDSVPPTAGPISALAGIAPARPVPDSRVSAPVLRPMATPPPVLQHMLTAVPGCRIGVAPAQPSNESTMLIPVGGPTTLPGPLATPPPGWTEPQCDGPGAQNGAALLRPRTWAEVDELQATRGDVETPPPPGNRPSQPNKRKGHRH